MDFINNTSHPALNFEGIDTIQQEFHVIVMRQTFTWDNTGLMILAETQDPLCMVDEMVDAKDLMSGIVEESDLCHYKPKCDIIVKGNAYKPAHLSNKDAYHAGIHIQTPDKVIYAEPIRASKYAFSTPKKQKPKTDQYIKGDVLVDKRLAIVSPSSAVATLESINGRVTYNIKTQKMNDKTSLNPVSSFGGYCSVDADHPAINDLDAKELIPEKDREAIRLNEEHGCIAYFAQDTYNPAGSGYMSSVYYKAVKPKEVKLPQIYPVDKKITESQFNKMTQKGLDKKTHHNLVAGFGIRAKSHPERIKFMGDTKVYMENGKGDTLPDDFDFAMWNCAYPDQQVEKMVGNEWITLTNLCHAQTVAATVTEKGDTQLRLYLPEMLAYVLTNSYREDMQESEVPMKLDTIILSPDEQKVNLVWRGIVSAAYDPKTIFLEVADRKKQEEVIRDYFTQKGEIVRPYQQGERS